MAILNTFPGLGGGIADVNNYLPLASYPTCNTSNPIKWNGVENVSMTRNADLSLGKFILQGLSSNVTTAYFATLVPFSIEFLWCEDKLYNVISGRQLVEFVPEKGYKITIPKLYTPAATYVTRTIDSAFKIEEIDFFGSGLTADYSTIFEHEFVTAGLNENATLSFDPQ